MHRVSCGGAWYFVFFERLFKKGHMDVAEPFDLGLRHALGDEFLLHVGDLRRGHVLNEFLETVLEYFHVHTLVEIFDYSLQDFLSHLRIIQVITTNGFCSPADGHILPGFFPDFPDQISYEIIEIQFSHGSRTAQGGHFSDRLSHDRILQVLEMGRFTDEKIQQEGITVQQIIDFGLFTDFRLLPS